MIYFDILPGSIANGPNLIFCAPHVSRGCGVDYTVCHNTLRAGPFAATGTVIDDEAVKAAYVRLIEAEIDVLKSVHRAISEGKKEP